MSLLKKSAVKTVIATTLLVGGLTPVTASAMGPVQFYKVSVAADLGNKVKDVQRKLRPAGNVIKRPIRKAALWVDHNMSAPALLLMFAFGAVFVLMGSSGASSRTGNYH